MRQSMKLPSSHTRSAGWLPSVAAPAHRCPRGARIDAQAQHSAAPVEESNADTSELEEIEALRLENERLRLRAREIGAKLPERAIVSDVLNDVVASLPGREEPTEQQSVQPLAAENSESRTIDPQVDAPSFADKSQRIVKNGVSSLSNGARSQSAAVSSVSHQSARLSSPSSESNGSSSSLENRGSTPNPPRSTDNGAYSTYEVSSQPGADTSSLSPAGRKKSHEWQVLSAERLGLYASPHNSFPSELPTDELVPKGTVPNFLPPSNETGLLRRIPQSEDELLQEMEELELKNPSASLQALRETVKNFGSEAVGEKHIKFNQKALGSMLHNLVFVSAEAAPYSKTGGLGDVVGSLTVALAERGHRVMVVCPRYITTARDRKLMGRLHDCQTWVKVDLGNGEHWVNFHHEARGGVDWVFVEHVSFERPGGLYGNNQGIYADNLFRFALLSQAACEASLQLQLPQYASVHEHWKTLQNRSEKVVAPAQYPDVIGEHKCAIFGEEVTFVANDWHAGLVPLYLNHKYKPHGVFNEARTLVAIHNLAHQGTALAHEFPIFNLPQSAYHELEWIYEEPDGRRTPVVNIMKAALLAADSIVTVSETYAWQITREEHGVGLHSILQARRNRLVGILNGMDTTSWDPATDPHLPMNYSPVDLTGKAYCKAALRRKLGLPEAEYGVDVPLVGFVGRLDPQKGPDIIISALSGLLALDCQIVMLGSGHPHLEQQMKEAERDHPDFFRGVVQFSEPLAHEIMAASDILLMPSRFEPCGLNQMHAMRYGTVPIAHATGGLQDTVLDVTPFAQGTTAHGTGWTFSPASDDAMIAAVKAAVQVYRDNGERWQNIQLAGMNSDWGWGHAAQSYESVVRSVLAPVDER